MATQIFSTWAALRDAIKDAIATASVGESFIRKSYTNPDGVSVVYKSYAEMLRDLDRIESRAQAETDGRPLYRPFKLRQVH